MTNNPWVANRTIKKSRILKVNGGALEVFLLARKLVYQGYSLLTHPLMGSVKPWHNPYRSVVLQKSCLPLAGKNITIIENAVSMLMARAGEMGREYSGSYDPEILAGFRLLDKELIGQT